MKDAVGTELLHQLVLPARDDHVGEFPIFDLNDYSKCVCYLIGTKGSSKMKSGV